MAKLGRKRRLTAEQVAELRRRYQLWHQNVPQRLCSEFGITRRTLRHYVLGRHKETTT